MAQPKLRCRRKLPVPPVRTMDLLGVGKDGQLFLWEAAAQVQPLSAFERMGQHIVSGHYVIDHRGSAVTVHCGNTAAGAVVVQYMCGGLADRVLDRKALEPALLGRVIPDPDTEAEICEMLRHLTDEALARQTAPHLRRGTL